MKSWDSSSERPAILTGSAPAPTVWNSATGELVALPLGQTSLYVCGITPYDATHLGHAATYLAFDLLQRIWRDAGAEITYIQNVTDIDDPLLERAEKLGVNYQDLAISQTDLYRSDMAWLGVLAPTHFQSVVAAIEWVRDAVEKLLEKNLAYWVGNDVYGIYHGDDHLQVAGLLSAAEREEFYAERGGDPERAGKRHPFDPLLWHGAVEGEPWWEGGSLGPGRPGWHIECAVIANKFAAMPMTVQGGGSDLVFPHHEFSAQHLTDLTGNPAPLPVTMHAAMVHYQGEKMSKSLGNLVLASKLREQGVSPQALRLLIMQHHYRKDWEYTDELLASATEQARKWQNAFANANNGKAAQNEQTGGTFDAHLAAQQEVVAKLRQALSQDLDTPHALAIVDAWVSANPDDGGALVAAAVSDLLGVSW